MSSIANQYQGQLEYLQGWLSGEVDKCAYPLNESDSPDVILQLGTIFCRRLYGIRRALARIEDPKFGFCQMCEMEIEEERLKLFPETELCSYCRCQARDHSVQGGILSSSKAKAR